MSWLTFSVYVVLYLASIALGLRIVDKQTGRLSTKMVHWLAVAVFVLGLPVISALGSAGETNAVLIEIAKSIKTAVTLPAIFSLNTLLGLHVKAWDSWWRVIAYAGYFVSVVALGLAPTLAISLASEAAPAQPGIAAVLAALVSVVVWLLIVWSASRWVAARVEKANTGLGTGLEETRQLDEGHVPSA